MSTMMDKKRVVFCGLVCVAAGLAVFGSSSVWADQDLVGTRAHGMGGARRASPAGIHSLLLNPATMSLQPKYFGGVNYNFRSNDSGHLVSVGIIDSVTSAFAAGINYSFVSSSPSRVYRFGPTLFPVDETITTHQVTVGGSYGLGNFLHLGVTTQYINASSDLGTVGLPAQLSPVDLSKFTMTVGGVMPLFGGLNLAVVGYHLISVDDYYFPRSLGTGISYAFGNKLLVEFDMVFDFTSDPNGTSLSYHGGAEVKLNPFIALRAGAQHQNLHGRTAAGGGLSLISPRARLDFAYRQTVNGGSGGLFSGTLTVFIM